MIEEDVKRYISSIKEEFILINSAAIVGSVHFGLEQENLLIEENTKINLNIFSALNQVDIRFKLLNYLSNCLYPHKTDIQREPEIFEGEPHASALAYAHTKRHSMILFEILKNKKNCSINQLILPGVFGAGISEVSNGTRVRCCGTVFSFQSACSRFIQIEI